ncbi:hypothetical protein BCR35DRAFT_155194 [Leucosporidium creatinivorum]|uniref:Uncharacterized protein n=1 Tax=Leucosporidium creatinivorum TaxID=106004 RepID=A0A1Y2FZI7_9BASI|nr:hypothetical protein BCR35DRAFT_155194 [Leucosporidium creatinivorum]
MPASFAALTTSSSLLCTSSFSSLTLFNSLLSLSSSSASSTSLSSAVLNLNPLPPPPNFLFFAPSPTSPPPPPPTGAGLGPSSSDPSPFFPPLRPAFLRCRLRRFLAVLASASAAAVSWRCSASVLFLSCDGEEDGRKKSQLAVRMEEEGLLEHRE